MEKKKTEIVYAEPADYFPKEIRRKYKLGEFAENKTDEKVTEGEAACENGGEIADE